MEMERRFLSHEVRLDEVEGERRMVGYGAVFNSLSEDLGGFRELIKPGAFQQAITDDDVRSLFNHDFNLVLGRNRAGTLLLREDETGLRYEIVLPETSYAQDLAASMARGDVDQSSFGFRVVEESWREPTEEQPYPVRVLHQVNLFDVGPVTIPAYPQTSAQVRSYIQQLTAHGGATAGGAAQRADGRLATMRRHLDLLERL